MIPVSLITRLEIDVMQESELGEAIEHTVSHKINNVVIHPDLISSAIFNKARRQSMCNLLIPVDWPKGQVPGISKLHAMSLDALSQNGFEIMLSPNTNKSMIGNEITALTDFILDQLSPLMMVRYVINTAIHNIDYVKALCDTIGRIRVPNGFRIQCKALDLRADIIGLLKQSGIKDIKVDYISDNATDLKYAVTIKQLKSIIRQIQTRKNDPVTA